METFLIKAAQLVCALALLVVLHEFGHYIFARIFGIKVEKFYLFFNPGFSLFKWKPKRKASADASRASWRDTEYGVGWLPLGGYVKIAGMIDESMDKEQMAQPPQPWEFRSKPAWQRLLVMLGGVLFNLIVAIIIYAGIAIYWGDKYIPLDAATEGYDFAPAAIEAGFRNGDIPLSADGKRLDAADESWAYKMVDAKVVQVLRARAGGTGRDTVSIFIPEDFIFKVSKQKGLLALRVPVVVDRLTSGHEAQKAGLLEGDRIIAVDSIRTPAFTEFSPALKAAASRPTELTVVRGADTLQLSATPDEFGKLGFQLRAPQDIFRTVTVKYGLIDGVPRGVQTGFGTLSTYVSSMKHIFSREGAQSIGGFGAMGSMFPDKWNWYMFWQITAFFSVALAFMNVLPIPALDGGHVMFLLGEVITGRKLPDRVMEVMQYIGMALLLCLLLYANGMDLVRALF